MLGSDYLVNVSLISKYIVRPQGAKTTKKKHGMVKGIRRRLRLKVRGCLGQLG